MGSPFIRIRHRSVPAQLVSSPSWYIIDIGSQVPQDASAAAQTEAELGIFGPIIAHPPPNQLQEKQRQQQQQQQEHHRHQQRTAEEPDREGETGAVSAETEDAASAAAAAAAATPGADLENTRKRQIDRQQQQPVVNGSPAKRPRLSNGYENGVADAATTPMEIDGQGHQGDNNSSSHAYPSPLEGDPAPTPHPQTDGPEQGTQVEKVEELATETTFVPLGPSDDNAPASASSPLGTTLRMNGNGESPPVLLHCQWNPRDPTILAAAGTDALARIWTVSRGAATDPDSGHVNGIGIAPQFHSLIDDDVPPKATVTAMAWNWDGTAIAVATDSDFKGRLSLWSANGAHLHNFEVPEPPIIKLRWNPNNAAILGIAPDNGGSLITVFHAATSNTMSYYLPQHDLDSDPLDAAWTTETDFLLGGGELLLALRCTEAKIVEIQKFETRKGDSLTQIHFDWRSSLAATCGLKGFVDIWNINGKRREIQAHCDAVTALAWQPSSSLPSADERLLASGGEDGAIFIWNALAADGKPKCSMTMGPPIVALAFTPDGAFIAGATNERILIWKVGDHSIPRASWSRTPHPGWLSPRTNPESDEEDEHCLGWDSTGHKLAYGVNSRSSGS
ncbi:hypothetical protein DL771_011939 [Monosporascus sp. 5C6A]|nr:hypothetical protein DL771_011939 [Monosporascus sp. 5C6A]